MRLHHQILTQYISYDLHIPTLLASYLSCDDKVIKLYSHDN